VLLQSVNIYILQFKKKIDYRQLELFTILIKKNKQIYQLNLSAKYKAIYIIFYVLLLKFWYSRNKDSKPESILIENKKK